MQVKRTIAKDQEDQEASRKQNEEEITFMQQGDSPRSECVQNAFMHQGHNTTAKFEEGQKQGGYLYCVVRVFYCWCGFDNFQWSLVCFWWFLEVFSHIIIFVKHNNCEIEMHKEFTKFDSPPRQYTSRGGSIIKI